ncbi:hypothetical protein DFH09DRAFT_1328049 [Mycena vulgaris]|nr:hypothetical protein DFH09DRAFT_1328049 [Mycena vulgaris]
MAATSTSFTRPRTPSVYILHAYRHGTATFDICVPCAWCRPRLPDPRALRPRPCSRGAQSSSAAESMLAPALLAHCPRGVSLPASRASCSLALALAPTQDAYPRGVHSPSHPPTSTSHTYMYHLPHAHVNTSFLSPIPSVRRVRLPVPSRAKESRGAWHEVCTCAAQS